MSITTPAAGSEEGTCGDALRIDASGYVRRARRLADLSQRELAAAMGLNQSQIARIEGGREVSLPTFERILAIAGLRLAVIDESGSQIAPMPADVLRDRVGRRRPAHLDVHTLPELPTMRMLFREAVPPDVWHHLRAERDVLRQKAGHDAPPEQPTVSSVTQWKAHRTRRRVSR
ncbi:MAG TPA: helix-turn-helix transcriptional regulator [Microbacterium sp.]|nr:helix-turn-helix transcriptional regulator [Microbacterium sp.]